MHMLKYTSCDAQMEIAFAGSCRPLHDYRSLNHPHTHSSATLLINPSIPPRGVLAIYLTDLLLDLEGRFAALMGRTISSFAPSERKKPGRRHDAVDRRAPLRPRLAPMTGMREIFHDHCSRIRRMIAQ